MVALLVARSAVLRAVQLVAQSVAQSVVQMVAQSVAQMVARMVAQSGVAGLVSETGFLILPFLGFCKNPRILCSFRKTGFLLKPRIL